MSITDHPNSATLYARTLAHAFTHTTRDNGERVTVRKDDAPEWTLEAIRSAHCLTSSAPVLPNDWIYDKAESAAEFIDENARDIFEHEDRRHDLADEWADSAVDIGYAEQYQWAGAHGEFRELIEEAREDMGAANSHSGDIMRAQFLACRRIFEALAEAIEEQADDEPCAWLVNHALNGGYMPNDDAAGFEEWEDAAQYLADTLDEWADAYSEDAREDEPEVTRAESWASALRNGKDLEGEDIEGQPLDLAVFGEHFWITQGEG